VNDTVPRIVPVPSMVLTGRRSGAINVNGRSTHTPIMGGPFVEPNSYLLRPWEANVTIKGETPDLEQSQ
jgi:hypothetical protein